MKEHKICFIICADSKAYEQETVRYLKRLEIPKGYELEVLTIWEALSMTEGYNRGMQESDAKYKVYLHQDVFIIHAGFIQDVLELFKEQSIGMIGMVGAPRLPENGVMWKAERIGKFYTHCPYYSEESIIGEVAGDWQEVEAIDGLLMITQYDIPWREDLFKGWDFYDVSQSLEFYRKGYKVIVPNLREPWCIHDEGFLNMKDYYQARRIFIEEYGKTERSTVKGAEKNMDTEWMKGHEPKPKFNLQWYQGEDLYSEGDIEDRIIDLIASNEPEDYTQAIYDNYSWSTYYHLTHLRKNILNWYSFRPESSVLEIGCGLGAITDLLCEKCHDVTAVELSKKRAAGTLLRCRERENLEIIVGNLNDIVFEKKFDYITLIGVLEYQGTYTETENPYQDFLKFIKKLLKPDGKLLIAIENKCGLKYWCGAREDHTGIPFGGINQYQIGTKQVKTFSKMELKELVSDSGFQHSYFYYPMPDYKLPTVIYSEKKLPEKDTMQNFRPYYAPDKQTLIADEKGLYKDVIENNVFEFFANSFLVECSDNTSLGEVTFANLSSERRQEYRIITRFTEDRKVEKFCIDRARGRKHLEQIEKNQIALENAGLKVWPTELQKGTLVSDFCESELLENRILTSYRAKDKAEIFSIFEWVYGEILHSSRQLPQEENIMFSLEIDRVENASKYQPILKTGYLDMILRNAFHCEGEIYWFDQEWVLEAVPAKFVLYRILVEFYRTYAWAEMILPLEALAEKFEILPIWQSCVKLNNMFNDTVVDWQHLEESNVYRDGNQEVCIANIEKLMNT